MQAIQEQIALLAEIDTEQDSDEEGIELIIEQARDYYWDD